MLRGSLLLRTYCPRSPRLPEDLDFLALDENEPSLAEQRVRDVCSVAANDGVEFDAKAIQVRPHSSHSRDRKQQRTSVGLGATAFFIIDFQAQTHEAHVELNVALMPYG